MHHIMLAVTCSASCLVLECCHSHPPYLPAYPTSPLHPSLLTCQSFLSLAEKEAGEHEAAALGLLAVIALLPLAVLLSPLLLSSGKKKEKAKVSAALPTPHRTALSHGTAPYRTALIPQRIALHDTALPAWLLLLV